jgi:L-malate glycosyltransferase
MEIKVLFILSSFNLFGGTPKKTLDMMNYFKDNSVLYVYDDSYIKFKSRFVNTRGKVYEGYYRRNIFKHLIELLNIVDRENINIIQTQFTMGEILAVLVKLFRPKIKIIISFVSPFKTSGVINHLIPLYRNNIDKIIYVSKYVQKEKIKQCPYLKKIDGEIIYNGAELRLDNGEYNIKMKRFALLTISGLIDCKNVEILIKAINIIVNHKNKRDIHLYVAGDGPKKKDLEKLISGYSLSEHIFLLGYQSNIGMLLDSCDIYVHPAYSEGFGIAVAEAMHSKKPIIISNAGALPELIEHEISGLIVNPFNPEHWATNIIRLIQNKQFAKTLGLNAKLRAEDKYSIQKFVEAYESVYISLTSKSAKY